MISEFDFKINHIKGKENQVIGVLRRSLQLAHVETMRTCEIDTKENIKEALLHDENFQYVK